MGILRPVAVVTTLSTILLSILWRATLDLAQETFLQCLLENSLRSHPISAAIYTPQSSSYSSVLESYIRNLRFNETSTPKPFLILTASHESHIQAAVLCAKKQDIQMKVRSGGHDYEGLSYVSTVPFFVLDMFNLRSVDVDIGNETAWVQTGATLGEVYYRIAERSNIHGFPAGVCPTVGVGGHLSGAGYGNMMRKYGVSADNIIDAQFIDANGRLLDRKSMGEELFWAIRGGGGASFGVILAYKIKLVRVPQKVTSFQVERTLEENATDIVDQWQHVADKLPEELFIRLALDVVNSSRSGEKTVRASFISLFLGDSETLLSIMNERFPKLGLSKSDCIETSWVRSVLFWADIPIETKIDVLLDRTPQTLVSLKRKSDYVKEPIPKAGLEGIWKRMIELQVPKMFFNPYGGKMAEIPSTKIPFPHRAGNLWKIQYLANWNESGIEAANHHIGLTRKLYDYMTPFVSRNPREAYLNYRDVDLGTSYNGKPVYSEGRVYGIRYFKGNFDRLVQIKSKVDPSNFFRNEQSIPVLPYQENRDDQ
ncbi:berberine bridge enzyme-like 8 [Herrania umbratica]|uniref:Berberine bridge enzyme-like 8 n=1 Tax=Herrania umbratica TaxID=108875 RepID=A0A6J1ATM4_9ROSI|nr:berberine bridge enzyme-like 8 [Herrania umbratica]XP_021290333.1 berberine bridge enzyme-like 8 [Herrania umbratica]